MEIKQVYKDERGFWAAFMLMLTVTLALLGMGGAVLIRSEAASIARKINTMQVDYAADSALFFALGAMQADTFTSGMTIPDVGGASSTMTTTNSGSNIVMRIHSEKIGSKRNITITLSKRIGAMTSEGDINWRIVPLDERGFWDPNLSDDNVASPPVVDVAALEALSNSQGYKKTSDYTATNNYPATNFYKVDGVTPNVIYVNGNLTIPAGFTVYGIFVVTGTVSIGPNAKVIGIIHTTTNSDITVNTNGSRHSVEGGIVATGNVNYTGGFISYATVKYNANYMETFQTYGNISNVSNGNSFCYIKNIKYY